MKLAIFTDYDGTITVQDTVDLVLDTFGAADWRDTSARIDATGAGDNDGTGRDIPTASAPATSSGWRPSS